MSDIDRIREAMLQAARDEAKQRLAERAPAVHLGDAERITATPLGWQVHGVVLALGAVVTVEAELGPDALRVVDAGSAERPPVGRLELGGRAFDVNLDRVAVRSVRSRLPGHARPFAWEVRASSVWLQ